MTPFIGLGAAMFGNLNAPQNAVDVEFQNPLRLSRRDI
jgi:hypothetical protein